MHQTVTRRSVLVGMYEVIGVRVRMRVKGGERIEVRETMKVRVRVKLRVKIWIEKRLRVAWGVGGLGGRSCYLMLYPPDTRNYVCVYGHLHTYQIIT